MHPSDKDLDELEAALAAPDHDDLDLNSEKYLRAVRAMRIAHSNMREQIMRSEEEFDVERLQDRDEKVDEIIRLIRSI